MMAAVRFWFGIVICEGHPKAKPRIGMVAHCPYHDRAGKTDDFPINLGAGDQILLHCTCTIARTV
jgi:hypothetical protein